MRLLLSISVLVLSGCSSQLEFHDLRGSDWDDLLQHSSDVVIGVIRPDVRPKFCQLYQAEYPGDRENGCPANRPPPATRVTAEGDVPLVGEWPQ